MLKRDKVISVRVNSDLLRKVNDKLSKNIDCVEFGFVKKYYNHLGEKFDEFSKVTLADLFEVALKEFVSNDDILFF